VGAEKVGSVQAPGSAHLLFLRRISASPLRANTENARQAEDGRAKGRFDPILLANARRCMARGNWDDAAARLYRACEMIAQIVLLEKHGQNTSRIDLARLPEEVRQKLDFRSDPKAPAPQKRLSLGLEESWQLLRDLGEPIAEEFFSRYGEKRQGRLGNDLNARNQSLLGHGCQPIAAEKAQDLAEHVQVLADQACGDALKACLASAQPVRFRIA
jgi:CRISPR-associated protein (TIGR02710 family)